jgi:hypothetical protein
MIHYQLMNEKKHKFLQYFVFSNFTHPYFFINHYLFHFHLVLLINLINLINLNSLINYYFYFYFTTVNFEQLYIMPLIPMA